MARKLEPTPLHLKPITSSAIRAAMDRAGNLALGELPAVYGLVAEVPRGILKIKYDTLSEIFGYQLARQLGVRVPRCEGFWLADPMRLDRQEQTPEIEVGDFGLVVEYLADWTDCDEEWATALDAEMTGKALALRAFDGGEKSELGIAGGVLHVADLEGVLPPYGLAMHFFNGLGELRDLPDEPFRSPEELRAWAARDFHRAGRTYGEVAAARLDRAFGQAHALGVLTSMVDALALLRQTAATTPSVLRLSGHPRSRMFRCAAERALRQRLTAACHDAILWSLIPKPPDGSAA